MTAAQAGRGARPRPAPRPRDARPQAPQPEQRELPPGRAVLVGRAATSDVPIYDPTISRRHAELALAPNGVQVRDLGRAQAGGRDAGRLDEALAGVGALLVAQAAQ